MATGCRGSPWVPITFSMGSHRNPWQPMAMGSHGNCHRLRWAPAVYIPLAITIIATGFGGFPWILVVIAMVPCRRQWELPSGITMGAHDSVGDRPNAFPMVPVESVGSPRRRRWLLFAFLRGCRGKFPRRKTSRGNPRNPMGTR